METDSLMRSLGPDSSSEGNEEMMNHDDVQWDRIQVNTATALHLITDTRPIVDYTNNFEIGGRNYTAGENGGDGEGEGEGGGGGGGEGGGDDEEGLTGRDSSEVLRQHNNTGKAFLQLLRFLKLPLFAYFIATVVVLLTSYQTCLLLAVGVCLVRASFLVRRENHYDQEKRLVTLACVASLWAVSMIVPILNVYST